jgi:hypothetical protein
MDDYRVVMFAIIIIGVLAGSVYQRWAQKQVDEERLHVERRQTEALERIAAALEKRP